MVINENEIKQLVEAELSRSDVRSVVKSELSDYVNSREFEKAVRKITADVFEKFFRMMYAKRGVWKSDVQNGQ